MDQAWIDPRYAALVARYRQQQRDSSGSAPLAVGVGGTPALRGFVMEPMQGEQSGE
jgi:hypothetical protein